eukprot:scaffold270083_cov22-Tisochrysis_lutea.AAC.1
MWLGAELGIKGNNVTRIEHVLKQALTSLFIAFVTLFGASFEGVHEAGHECGHAGVVMLHGDFTDGNACQVSSNNTLLSSGGRSLQCSTSIG